jgi:hypothetical protein
LALLYILFDEKYISVAYDVQGRRKEKQNSGFFSRLFSLNGYKDEATTCIVFEGLNSIAFGSNVEYDMISIGWLSDENEIYCTSFENTQMPKIWIRFLYINLLPNINRHEVGIQAG